MFSADSAACTPETFKHRSASFYGGKKRAYPVSDLKNTYAKGFRGDILTLFGGLEGDCLNPRTLNPAPSKPRTLQ